MRRLDTLVSVVGKLNVKRLFGKKQKTRPMSFAEYFESGKGLTELDVRMNEAYKGLRKTVEYVMYRLFCRIDADGSGYVSKKELREFLGLPANAKPASERGVEPRLGQTPFPTVTSPGSAPESDTRNDIESLADFENEDDNVVFNDVFEYKQLRKLLDIFEANEHQGKELSLKDFLALMVQITRDDDKEGDALTVRGLFMIYAVLMDVVMTEEEKVKLRQSKKKDPHPVELVVTLNGITKMLAECFPNLNHSKFVISTLFNKVDKNRDNRLQFVEFKCLMNELKEDGQFIEKNSKPKSQEEYFRENPDCLTDEQRGALGITKDLEYAYYCHFCDMDKDGNGRLTLDEMANALGHLIDSPLDPDIIQDWLRKLEIKIDKDGLCFEEFLRLTKSAKEFKQAEALDLFNHLKDATDDSITREKFHEYVRALRGNNQSQASTDCLFNKFDTNRDGKLQFAELFEGLVRKDIENPNENI